MEQSLKYDKYFVSFYMQANSFRSLKNPSSNIILLETLYQKYGLYPLQNGGERRADKIRFEVFIRGAG